MPVGRQAATIAAVAFGIGIGIGFTCGGSSSHHGRRIKDPAGHDAGVDAGRPATASSEAMATTPPDAPDTVDAKPDATPGEATLLVRDPSPPVIDVGEKRTQPTNRVEPSKRKRNVQGGSKRKVGPATPAKPPIDPIDPFGSPD